MVGGSRLDDRPRRLLLSLIANNFVFWDSCAIFSRLPTTLERLIVWSKLLWPALVTTLENEPEGERGVAAITVLSTAAGEPSSVVESRSVAAGAGARRSGCGGGGELN